MFEIRKIHSYIVIAVHHVRFVKENISSSNLTYADCDPCSRLKFQTLFYLALPTSHFQSQFQPFQCLNQLNEGARFLLTHPLQSLLAPNISSAYQYVLFITDNTVSWIKKVMSTVLSTFLNSLLLELTLFRKPHDITESRQF
jgi:hypothetical protein